jgi:hypothetical protein
MLLSFNEINLFFMYYLIWSSLYLLYFLNLVNTNEVAPIILSFIYNKSLNDIKNSIIVSATFYAIPVN